MAVQLEASAATHPGLHHPRNEDAHRVLDTPEGGRLLLVCDGMGGMGRGDEASAVAVEVLCAELLTQPGFPSDRLRSSLRVADQTVRDRLCGQGEGQPGSTAVMVYVLDGAAHVAWVGDSRAYLVRAGRVIDRTRDHKLVEELVDAGQLTPEQARASALSHVVTRALGGRTPDDPAVRPSVLPTPWKLMNGDRVLVCSDGLCDLVEDAEMGALVTGGTTEETVAQLVQVALDRGGHDNITVVLGTWLGLDWVEEDAATPVMQTRELALLDLRLADEETTLPPDAFDNSRVTEEIAPDRAFDAVPPALRPTPEPTERRTPPGEATRATPAPTQRRTPPPPVPRPGSIDSAPRPEPDRRWMAAALAVFALIAAATLLWFSRT